MATKRKIDVSIIAKGVCTAATHTALVDLSSRGQDAPEMVGSTPRCAAKVELCISYHGEVEFVSRRYFWTQTEVSDFWRDLHAVLDELKDEDSSDVAQSPAGDYKPISVSTTWAENGGNGA